MKIHCFIYKILFYLSCVYLILACGSKQKTDASFLSALKRVDTYIEQNPTKALFLLDSLQDASSVSGRALSLITFKKGELFYLNKRYAEAISAHKKAYKLFSSSNDLYNKTRSLITLSAANLRLDRTEKAQEYALEALHTATILDNKRLLAKANNQLFQLHFLLKDYPKALGYIQAADSLFVKQKDTTSIIAIKSNMAAVYVKQKQYNKALATYQASLSLGNAKRAAPTMVSILNNIGFTYIEAKKYDLATDFLQAAIQVNKAVKTINAAPYKGLGYVYWVQKDTLLSRDYYQRALSFYQEQQNLPEQIMVLDKLIALAIQNNTTNALAYQLQRDTLQRQLQQQEKEKLLHFVTIKYKVKEKELALLHQRQTHEKNRLLQAGVFICLVLLLLLLAAYLYISKLKTVHKTSLLEQRLLRVQMNPHFIFNTLAAIQNITLEGDPLKSSNYIAKFSKLIRQNFEYVRKEQISLSQEIAMIANYITTQQLRFSHSFAYVLELDKNCDADAIKIPPMLLQPFLENAIEYGFKGIKTAGVLVLKITQQQHYLCFTIQDNGVGRSNKAKQNTTAKSLHATTVFLERLQMRKKAEEKTFSIEDLYDVNKNPIGTKVSFKLKIT